jgi:hypothetical protein
MRVCLCELHLEGICRICAEVGLVADEVKFGGWSVALICKVNEVATSRLFIEL